MRIPSGVTDQYIYFVALDDTDYVTRVTGLSGFTVYRSRNGGAAASYTTPTVNETDSSNMPGVYELLLDEDMTIDSGDQSQEVCLHITKTGMAPVTRTFELYRPDVTAGETLTVSSGNGNAAVQSIANGAITAAAIATDAIDADAIADGAITSGVFAAGAITATVIADGAIDAATFAAGAITATVIADGAIDAATFASGAIDAAALAADAGTEIGTAVWATVARTLTAIDEDNTTLDLDATIRAAVGLASANLDTQLDALPTAAENATAVWGAGTRALTVLDEDSTTLDLDATIRSAVGLASANLDTQISDLPTNAELATALDTADDAVLAAVATVDAVVDAIKVKTDSLTFTVAGSVDANIQHVNDVQVNGTGAAGDEWGP